MLALHNRTAAYPAPGRKLKVYFLVRVKQFLDKDISELKVGYIALKTWD